MKVAIVGAGKLGLKVAYALVGGDHSITLIDKDEETLQKISSQLDVMTIAANGKDVKVLKDIHISTFDFLVAATDRDEKNIVIASFAKKLGCSKVIARVRDPEHIHQYDFIRDTMEIDYLINPDMAVTMEIYKKLVEQYTLHNGILTMGKSALLEFFASRVPGLTGRYIKDVGDLLPNMVVGVISRNGKVTIPHGDTRIEEGDALYVMGEKSALQALDKEVHEKSKYTDLQRVMIIGGGKTGFFLSQKLSEAGLAVKIIERDKDRCYYIAEHLENVMVLHGDGTDISLLEDENLDEMDAFVTCTGFDEDNLILALMAKQRGIEDVIAKLSRGIYTDLVSNMGVDMALNTLDISVSNILLIIQGSKRIVSSQLINGQAEVLEVVINSRMRSITGKAIKNLKLPAGVIIGPIHRGDELIIPNGTTVLKTDDKVTLICMLTEIANLERLLRTTGRIDFLK